MESEKIAKRAVKISIGSVLFLFFLSFVLLSILLTQIDATAEMSRQIKALSIEVMELKNSSLKSS